MLTKLLYSRQGGSMDSVGHGAVTIHVYNEDREGTTERFYESSTCENICVCMAQKLGITPTMLHCFGLAVYCSSRNKYHWLAPFQKPADISTSVTQLQQTEIHFRMRFVPDTLKRIELEKLDAMCYAYLVWQVKWDFLHSRMACFLDESKRDEARGYSCLLILLQLRRYAEKEGVVENLTAFMKKKNVNEFLPISLQKSLLEKKLLKSSMRDRVETIQRTYPQDSHSSQFIMKWCLKTSLEENSSYYIEAFTAYDLHIEHETFATIDDEEPTQIVEMEKLLITVKMEQSVPKLRVVKEFSSRDHISCCLDNVSQLEISEEKLDGQTWWRVYMFLKDAHPQMLYFKERSEVYSFATCVECYSRLIYDFYGTVCQQLEPSIVKELNRIRAHGPVSDKFVEKKLKRRKSKDLYVLRANLFSHGQYDVLYLQNIGSKMKLKPLPEIEQSVEGYTIAGSQDPPMEDFKAFIMKLVLATNMFPGTCQRIRPQSEGCNVLQNLLMGQDPPMLYDEDELQERRRLENQPKVYTELDVKLLSLIGQGHFTKVSHGLLCDQDQVIIKQLRVEEIGDNVFRIVQEAFREGFAKLMILREPQYFVGFLGQSLSLNVCMLMKGTSYGSLRQFLRAREPGLPMLSLHHLVEANMQLAEALVYMEEKHCYHGNLHCDNIAVMNYDSRAMFVQITDPGLVSLYNKLPLYHPINRKRLPWLAPELHSNLAAVTCQTEVFAYGTTLWQMFSQGFSPLQHDPNLNNKSVEQIVEYFARGNVLSCPQFLQVKHEDAIEVHQAKEQIFNVMKSCWRHDDQERDSPKLILKNLSTNLQSYEDTYHKYSIIPYFDMISSATSYPVSFPSTDRTSSSGFINNEDAVSVPDIACVITDGSRNIAPPLNQIVNRALPHNGTEQTTGIMLGNQRPAHLHGLSQTPMIDPRGAAGHMSTRPMPELPLTMLLPHRIDESRLKTDFNSKLGEGHYGAVYKGKLFPTASMMNLSPTAEPETVVIKVLKSEMVEKHREEFKKEAEVMAKLKHENVVKFHGICRGGEYLVMEFVENNSLYKYVAHDQEHRISPQTFLQLGADIASGMDYLESQKVLHCDLAARNILLTAEPVHAKISDFGLSKILAQDKDYYKRTSEKTIPILWCAPEWIRYKRFTSKSDVWSFGVVMWEMYSYGKVPFLCKDIITMAEKLHKGDRLKEPRDCPHKVRKLMLDCWKAEPDQRPTFMQCKTRFKEMLLQDSSNVARDNCFIDKADLEVDRAILLGQGAFGAVYKGSYRGEVVAVKECIKPDVYSRFRREYLLLHKLTIRKDSTNIVRFIGLYEVGDMGTIKEHMYVMEYLEMGSLWQYLDNQKLKRHAVNVHTKLRFLVDIAKGMDYLFRCSIIHCDLTARNVLLSGDLTAKIGDFGWAKELESKEDNFQYSRKENRIQPLWAAPEVFSQEFYTKYSDIWSYGVVGIEVFQDGATPVLDVPLPPVQPSIDEHMKTFYKAILDGRRYPRPPQCPEHVYSVILKCWEKDHQARILFKDIISALTREEINSQKVDRFQLCVIGDLTAVNSFFAYTDKIASHGRIQNKG